MKKLSRIVLAGAMLAGATSIMTACDSVKAAEYKAGDPVKVGLICLHGEESTYDNNFIKAMKEAATELGEAKMAEPIIKTGVGEDKSCLNAAKELVKQGCNVIFADSFGHEPYMKQAAKKWPTVQFCHATGTQAKVAGLDNFHNAFASIYEGRYLAGYAAGLKLNKMTIANNQKDSNGAIKLGYVGAFPYAEVVSGYTSWYLGVKAASTQPVVMSVTYTSSWYDFNAEKAAAEGLIQSGVALMSQHADSYGAPGACEAAGVPDVSYNLPTSDQCPNTYTAYSRINWAPYYKEVVNAVANGTKMGPNFTGTLTSGSVEWDVVDAADKVLVQAVEAELKAGTRKVFDCANFTVTKTDKVNTSATVDADGHLTAYLADVDDMGDFVPETNVIRTENGKTFFDESALRSAPYFDVRIDGITELNNQ